MQKQLIELLRKGLEVLIEQGVLVEMPNEIILNHSRDKSQGDFASNVALILSKQAKLSPQKLAKMIVKNLPEADFISKVEVAGVGFINFFINQDERDEVISKILTEADNFGKSMVGDGQRILLEFVSANPTGPLHVGHGRGAAFGATMANLLREVGFEVVCEYYVNDAGRQMDILATSVYLRYIGCDKFPENGYKGDYILDIAGQISGVEKVDIFAGVCADEAAGGDKEKHIDGLIKNAKTLLGKDYEVIFDLAIENILGGIKKDLKDFGVDYQQWFYEKNLADDDFANKTIKKLQDGGFIYQKNGALWFKTTDFGDEKDRVVVRENGAHTYFASDIAYHLEKFNRGFDKIINIWGADHHGYVQRVRAAMMALGLEVDKFEVLLVQFAHLFRGKTKVPMSTRSGSFVTLSELVDEVGIDAARFFYILRKSEQGLDFDLNLAKSKSNKNPVFYIQYAHARINSVLEKAEKFDHKIADFALLTDDAETKIIRQLSRYPHILQSAAINYEPHILAYYLRDLAADFHTYYNVCEFLKAPPPLKSSRLLLITAVQQVIKNALNLLGVEAADEM